MNFVAFRLPNYRRERLTLIAPRSANCGLQLGGSVNLFLNFDFRSAICM
jgi:hypothetical protein